MKKSKKLISLIVAAVMAFGVLVAPMEALAVGATSLGKDKLGNFVISSVSKKQVKLKNLTKKGQNKTKITITKTYKLQKTKFTDSKTNYKVIGIKAKAFKDSKAKTIVIKPSLKPATCTNMLKGIKTTGKITIKVPKAQVSAWKKAAKAGKLGIKGSRIVIQKI